MRRPKIVLIQPNYQGGNHKRDRIDNIVGVHPPLGLLYLAARLRQDRFTPEIIDANYNRYTANETAAIAGRYDIVGVSLLNQGHHFALSLAQSLPATTLKICGGPHATGYAQTILEGGFDVVVRGEGEEALSAICGGVSFASIPGISWRHKDRFVHNKSAEFLDVSTIPAPARDLLPHGGTRWPYASAGTRVFPWAPVLTSRGCPFACYYCNKSIHGFAFRARSAEDVVSEIVELSDRYGVREIDIVDDVFNLDIERAMRICDLIVRSGIQVSLRFGNGIRADRITAELARKLREAGTTYVAFGLESGNQQVLDSIPKKIRLDQIRNGVRLIQGQGIHTTGLFILGLLADTEESMKETIRFAKQLRLDIAYFSIATPYPGTRFYDMVKARGRVLVDSWEGFNHSYGRLLYEYPGGPSPELVHRMFRLAYREFYLRPSFLLRQLARKRTLSDYQIALRGGKDLLRNLFLRGK